MKRDECLLSKPGLEPVLVNDHDSRSQADGIAIPYGIYDLQANRGSVVIGTSIDTPWFATDCLTLWYAEEGQKRYPDTTELLILADGGGSNRTGSYVWKYGLQTKLCNQFGSYFCVNPKGRQNGKI